jgi:hypothetical protein
MLSISSVNARIDDPLGLEPGVTPQSLGGALFQSIARLFKPKKPGRNDGPERVAIDHDDHHAEFIGSLADGRQFFLTTPFEPATATHPGCEYVALFLFSAEGYFAKARIETLGPRNEMNLERAHFVHDTLLESLGDVTYGRIEVAPFSVEHEGVKFGLILREPEDQEDVWAVEMQPGNYMAFFEPWDRGDYDT